MVILNKSPIYTVVSHGREMPCAMHAAWLGGSASPEMVVLRVELGRVLQAVDKTRSRNGGQAG